MEEPGVLQRDRLWSTEAPWVDLDALIHQQDSPTATNSSTGCSDGNSSNDSPVNSPWICGPSEFGQQWPGGVSLDEESGIELDDLFAYANSLDDDAIFEQLQDGSFDLDLLETNRIAAELKSEAESLSPPLPPEESKLFTSSNEEANNSMMKRMNQRKRSKNSPNAIKSAKKSSNFASNSNPTTFLSVTTGGLIIPKAEPIDTWVIQQPQCAAGPIQISTIPTVFASVPTTVFRAQIIESPSTVLKIEPRPTNAVISPSIVQNRSPAQMAPILQSTGGSAQLTPIVQANGGIADEPPPGLSSSQLNEWKRQQRLIKNREAATISRQRRKEYLASLEAKCHQLEEENSRLESENKNLKVENHRLLNENSSLKNLFLASEEAKIGNNGKNLRWSKTASRASVCLMGLMLIFSLSFGGKIFSFSAQNSQNFSPYQAEIRGRSLLVFEDAKNYQKFNDSAPNFSEIPNLKNSNGKFNNNSEKICPYGIYFNKSESIRLAGELSNWAERHKKIQNDYLLKKEQKAEKSNGKKNSAKNSGSRGQKNVLDPSPETSGSRGRSGPNPNPEVPTLSDLLNPTLNGKLRWNYAPQPIYQFPENFQNSAGAKILPVDLNSLQIYESPEMIFSQTLRRRDDTLYVVSFRGDYMLLPASVHNKTMRPRMSLVMPVLVANESNSTHPHHLTMIQIDCEVMGNRFFHVPEHLIPQLNRNASRNFFEEEENEKNFRQNRRKNRRR